MTNEQLKILLESQALLLKEALEKAVELMPENAKEEKIVTSIPFISYEVTMHTALIPLYEALETLQRQIDYLVKTEIVETGA